MYLYARSLVGPGRSYAGRDKAHVRRSHDQRGASTHVELSSFRAPVYYPKTEEEVDKAPALTWPEYVARLAPWVRELLDDADEKWYYASYLPAIRERLEAKERRAKRLESRK